MTWKSITCQWTMNSCGSTPTTSTTLAWCWCREVLEKGPLHLQALLYASEISLEQGAYKEAIQYCDTIVRGITGDFFIVWNTRGLALCHLDRHDEANACFVESLRCSPQRADTWSYLALCMYLSGHKNKALAFLNEAELNFGLAGKLELVRGCIERCEGNTTDALTHFIAGGLNADPSTPDHSETVEIFAREVRKTIDSANT